MPSGVYPRKPLKPKPNRQQVAMVRPSTHDIYWAAGIYEGEGSALQTGVSINQKDKWLIFRLQQLFGGHVTLYSMGSSKGPIWNWSACGSRGRGFIYTIYRLLSPRRQRRIRTSQATPGTFLGPIKNLERL